MGAGRRPTSEYIETVARTIAKVSAGPKIIVEKSTIPVKTAEAIQDHPHGEHADGIRFEVLSNPEFLAEGTAMADLLMPDRVLIGGETYPRTARKPLETLVECLCPLGAAGPDHDDEPVVLSELSKNWWRTPSSRAAHLLDQFDLGALRSHRRQRGQRWRTRLAATSRIGPKFLKASVGFGGSCFQKDILNLVYLCEHYGLPEVAAYWDGVVKMNDYQKRRFAGRISACSVQHGDGQEDRDPGLCLSRKTPTTRAESAAISVCRDLLAEQARRWWCTTRRCRPTRSGLTCSARARTTRG